MALLLQGRECNQVSAVQAAARPTGEFNITHIIQQLFGGRLSPRQFHSKRSVDSVFMFGSKRSAIITYHHYCLSVLVKEDVSPQKKQPVLLLSTHPQLNSNNHNAECIAVPRAACSIKDASSSPATPLPARPPATSTWNNSSDSSSSTLAAMPSATAAAATKAPSAATTTTASALCADTRISIQPRARPCRQGARCPAIPAAAAGCTALW